MAGIVAFIDGTAAIIDRFFHLDVSDTPSSRTPLMSREAQVSPAPAFEVSYTIPNHTFSGLKVDQLKVLGDVMYKPFKGVRMSAKAGRMEVRW